MDSKVTALVIKTFSIPVVWIGTFIFTIPLLLSGPQILVGTIVNALLFGAAIKLSRKYWLAIATLPSLGAVAHGVLFGPLTIFLVYFLPMIWLGNWLLMYLFSLQAKKIVWIFRLVVAASAKALLLFLGAKIYHGLGVVPILFLTAMGFNQLITALAGGILAKVALSTLND